LAEVKVESTLLAKLHDVCAARATLRLAVLFGSQATGQSHAGSDFDIGILPLVEFSLREELQLAQDLSELTGTEVDVVRLDGDDPLLGREVAETGVCIMQKREGEFAAYRARAMSTWIDFDETMAPHRKRLIQRLAGKVAADQSEP
jgi:predicted nucleotidyltransferase